MSISIKNLTPFPHLQFSNSDNQGREFGVVMIKAAFDINEGGQCVLASEHEPFNFTDRTYGELNVSSLRHPSDFVSYKKGTDVILDVIAHAPEGKPATDWIASIRVEDSRGASLEKSVRIIGPRKWLPIWRRNLTAKQKENWRDYRNLFSEWRLSDPQKITHLPVRYEYAYGGFLEKKDPSSGETIIEAYPYNPVGMGWIDKEWTDHGQLQPAPQIEDPCDPLRNPYKAITAAGLGPIPPHWSPRLQFAGTYDENWRKNIWPKWAPDYDFAYNHSAAIGLTSNKFLHGPLRISLSNLRTETSLFSFVIPDASPLIFCEGKDGEASLFWPNLDTAYLELAGDDLFDCRITLTWRTPFHIEKTERLFIIDLDDEDRAALVADQIEIGDAPHPSDCAIHSKILEKA